MEAVPSTSSLSCVEGEQSDKGKDCTNYSEPIADMELGHKNCNIVIEKNSDDFIKNDTYQPNSNEECNPGNYQSLPVTEVSVYTEFSGTPTNQVGVLLIFPNSILIYPIAAFMKM